MSRCKIGYALNEDGTIPQRCHVDWDGDFYPTTCKECPYIELEGTGIIGKWEGTPIIEVPALISWLNDQKYTNVDETSDDMTEEFEREHRWELSRNSFINSMVRKLKELK